LTAHRTGAFARAPYAPAPAAWTFARVAYAPAPAPWRLARWAAQRRLP